MGAGAPRAPVAFGAELTAERLRAALSARIAGFAAPVAVRAVTRSTNDDARAAAAAGAPALSAFAADAQTAGRGRGGRAWHSPPGENLYLSFLLRPAWEAGAAAPFALVVGLAVAEEIDRRLAAPAARVKWPNDVLVGGRKIAGVLLEGSIRAGRLASLVVGVGVDVHARSFPPDLAPVATSLAILGAEHRDRAALAADLVARVDAAASCFGSDGLAPFVGALSARDALSGRRVAVDEIRGVARGIDDAGRLVVERDDGARVPVVSGHVELLA
jgi:BirA family biotin operon repressor/biotin-[acetyl-CoA-carboxylase] ligase